MDNDYDKIFPCIRIFWAALNSSLAELCQPEALFREATYWFRRQYSPGTAAGLICLDRAEI
jgi:hypothetical protein